MPQNRFARFALALPLYRVFDYALEGNGEALPGTRYRLPFGNRKRIGILLDQGQTSPLDPARIKPVHERLDSKPVIDAHMMSLARWLADYYCQPLGEALFLCLPGYLRRANQALSTRVRRWRLTDAGKSEIEGLRRRAPRQYAVCAELLDKPGGLTALELKERIPGWRAPAKSLEVRGLLTWDWDSGDASQASISPAPTPSAGQAAVLERITAQLDRFAVHLLDGITGSGKTEIYLRLIQSRLEAGRQAIYLVPEIGLTGQLLERVRDRFGDNFALSHSGLTDLQRYRAWDRFRRGEVGIMLGTRSSLFSQSPRLGLIVIDEEHDPSYRQEDGVRYHARDIAIKRAQMLDIPVVLGSATPSLESLRNCQRETWYRHRLDRRPTRYPPPSISLVDVRDSHLDAGCGQRVLARVRHHLAQGGQVLMYLNRRGFAPVVMCHECGWQAQCRQCDARLTLHQSIGSLLCHHCGSTAALPEACPDCNHPEIRHYGIGTEQLEDGLAAKFSGVSVVRIDRDVIGSRGELDQRLGRLRDGEPCILVGTQMIAKGHDYPAITLAVVLDADQALFSASYRASERLAQTLYQVAGRSGRGDREGEALVQTRFPGHPLMQALANGDYRDIAGGLLAERQAIGFPPYAKVVVFRADAVELEAAMEMLCSIRERLASAQAFAAIDCVGPMPALMARRVGRYRAQLCLMSLDYRQLRAVLDESMPAIENIPGTARVNWTIDVDAFEI